MVESLEAVWQQADLMGLFLVLSLGLLTGFLSERFRFPNAVAQVLLGVV